MYQFGSVLDQTGCWVREIQHPLTSSEPVTVNTSVHQQVTELRVWRLLICLSSSFIEGVLAAGKVPGHLQSTT